MHAPRPTSIADGLHVGLDRALAADVSDLNDDELLDGLSDVYRAEARIAALKCQLIAAMDAQQAHAAVGAQTPAAWIARRCRVPLGTARHDVLVARSLLRLPATSAKLADGDIGRHHAARIALHHRNPRTTALVERDEAILARDAAELPWPAFVRVVGYWAQLADPDGTDQAAEDRKARRRLRCSRTLDGSWKLDALLDPVNGSIVHTAIEHVERELYAEDVAEARVRLGRTPLLHELRRMPTQRRADALVELARRAMSAAPGARRPAPLVTILVGYETFAGRICELADGTVLAPSDVSALLDTAIIERAVFDGPSRVTDIGQQRRFTGALRRAIELRDRT